MDDLGRGMEEMMRAESVANTAFSGRSMRHFGGVEESISAVGGGGGFSSEYFHRRSHGRTGREMGMEGSGGDLCEGGVFCGDDGGGGGFGCGPSSAASVATMAAAVRHRRSSSLSGDDMGQLQQKVKLMCRFGGQICPSGKDNQLTYVGGETRIQTVNRDVTFQELMKKLTAFYNQRSLILKYQLSNEGLDTLVTVSCEEDLVNMMEEYDAEVRSERAAARLKVFLFAGSEWDVPPGLAPLSTGRHHAPHPPGPHPPSGAGASGPNLSHVPSPHQYGGVGGVDQHSYPVDCGPAQHHQQHIKQQQQQVNAALGGYVGSPRGRPPLNGSLLDGGVANVEISVTCGGVPNQPPQGGGAGGGGGGVVAGGGQYHPPHQPYHHAASPVMPASPLHQQQHHTANYLLQQQQQQQKQQEQQNQQHVSHHSGGGPQPSVPQPPLDHLAPLPNFDHFKKSQFLLLTGPTHPSPSVPQHTTPSVPQHTASAQLYRSRVMSPRRSSQQQQQSQPQQQGPAPVNSPSGTFPGGKNGVQGCDEGGGSAVGCAEVEKYGDTHGNVNRVEVDPDVNRPLGTGHLRTVGEGSSPREQEQQEGGGGSPYGVMPPPSPAMDSVCSPRHCAFGDGGGEGGTHAPLPASPRISVTGVEVPQESVLAQNHPRVVRRIGKGLSDSNLNTLEARWRAGAVEAVAPGQAPLLGVGGGGGGDMSRQQQESAAYAWRGGRELQQNHTDIARVGGAISVQSPPQGGKPPDPFPRPSHHLHHPYHPLRVLETHGEQLPISGRLEQQQPPQQQYAHLMQSQYPAYLGFSSKLGFRGEHQGAAGGGHKVVSSAPPSPRFPTRQVVAQPQQQQQHKPAFRGSPPQHEPHQRMYEDVNMQLTRGRSLQQQQQQHIGPGVGALGYGEMVLRGGQQQQQQQFGHLSASPPREFGTHQRLVEEFQGSLRGGRHNVMGGLQHQHQQKMGSPPLSYDGIQTIGRTPDRGLVHSEQHDHLGAPTSGVGHHGHPYGGGVGEDTFPSFGGGGGPVGTSFFHPHHLQQQKQPQPQQQQQQGAYGSPLARVEYGSPMHYKDRRFEQPGDPGLAGALMSGRDHSVTVGMGVGPVGGIRLEGNDGGIAAELKDMRPGDDGEKREEPCRLLPERPSSGRRRLRLPEDREAFLAVPEHLGVKHRGAVGTDDESSLSYHMRGGVHHDMEQKQQQQQQGVSGVGGAAYFVGGAESSGGYHGHAGEGGTGCTDVPNSSWGAFIARTSRGSQSDLAALGEGTDCSGGSSTSSPGVVGVGQHQALLSGLHLQQGGPISHGNLYGVYACQSAAGGGVTGSVRTVGPGLMRVHGERATVPDAVTSSPLGSSWFGRADGGGHVESYDIEAGMIEEHAGDEAGGGWVGSLDDVTVDGVPAIYARHQKEEQLELQLESLRVGRVAGMLPGTNGEDRVAIGSEREGSSPAYVTSRGTLSDLHSRSASSQGTSGLDDVAEENPASKEKISTTSASGGGGDAIERGVRSPVCAECGRTVNGVLNDRMPLASTPQSARDSGVSLDIDCPRSAEGESLAARVHANMDAFNEGGGDLVASLEGELETAEDEAEGNDGKMGLISSVGGCRQSISIGSLGEQHSHEVRVVSPVLLSDISLEMGEGVGAALVASMKRIQVVTPSDAAASGSEDKEEGGSRDCDKVGFMSGLTISCSSINLPAIRESEDGVAADLILDVVGSERNATTFETDVSKVEELGVVTGGGTEGVVVEAVAEENVDGMKGQQQQEAQDVKDETVASPTVELPQEGSKDNSGERSQSDGVANVVGDDASQRHHKPLPITLQLENYKHQIIDNADLEELRELGSGTFGTVYHGKWKGTDVAIKRIKISCLNEQRVLDDFWKEANFLAESHHPNVVAFYGVVTNGPEGSFATVTEYMINGSLRQVLQRKDRMMDRRKRVQIALDAAFGMEYLHARNIIHFDLKCENLLVNMRDPQKPICKVGDLGLSKLKLQTMITGGLRGTLPWMAPELLDEHARVDEKVDVFSFGIIMWELLTGEIPYGNMHYGAVIGGIANNTLRPAIPDWCDPPWRSLMEKCWATDVKDRPTSSEVVKALREML